ncbi:nuclear transport factor 2 family protein [Chryseobacterium indologenes]|uniref:Nuclear transport factor 2 family protein n=2 Tax=Chryseobacterium indologenes TaxID=253 RepID=A0AAD0YUV6_CHRID|nr:MULTISPECIES: nuclear transport factor 2 family protein [Chryseobacterium]ASE62204.1 nuclear transport factor 2 family protein [Chryseobacterium indologenes]AYZ34871.1 nuclear transport factor 2 family protein [Chryseobacterium indologenes]AZB17918.1 nuclear transport factor 2 family protein [Chryseobacterium indologenes]MBF6643485.1 nuclear transport factor 2 family protein [Chryseobacterium indologenes]MBU3047486.1 nuclear transport factor 2 family protein [Chryseobacterium indologenes]
MNKLTGIFLLMGAMCFSQQNKGIEKPIRNLFLAMKNADTDLLKTVFTENAVLQTITKDGVVKTDSIQDFITSVSKFSQGDLEEKIIVEAVHTDGNLASVFTPYSFYLKGKFSHCGANSFQLVQQNNEWKIQYIIDTRRKDHCKEIE